MQADTHTLFEYPLLRSYASKGILKMMATQSLSSFVSPKFAFPARLPFLLAYPLFLMLGVFFRHIFVTISFFSTIVRYSFFSPAICLIYWREHVVLFVLSTLA